MPYITKDRRVAFDQVLREANHAITKNSTAGDFNYLVTMLTKLYVSAKGENYQIYNDLMGALEGCKLEMYRRQIAPYENKKAESNGDV